MMANGKRPCDSGEVMKNVLVIVWLGKEATKKVVRTQSKSSLRLTKSVVEQPEVSYPARPLTSPRLVKIYHIFAPSRSCQVDSFTKNGVCSS
jgi:hypothetical protein